MIIGCAQLPQQEWLLYSKGTSKEANLITRALGKGFDRLRESNTFGRASMEFEQVFNELRTSNWDGYGAMPASSLSYHYAKKFLNALPFGTEGPSFGADPDGQLTMEWYRSPNRILSLSIGEDSKIHYAASIGPSTTHGSEPFFDVIPETIQNIIERITTN